MQLVMKASLTVIVALRLKTYRYVHYVVYYLVEIVCTELFRNQRPSLL